MQNLQLKIAGTVNDSIVDGPGYRYSIFTQGCPHACPGCHNPQTHDPRGGYWMSTDDILSEIMDNPLLEGVTFSGGEPFAQAEKLAQLGSVLKQHGLTIWCFTGYTLEELQAKERSGVKHLLAVIDVLVDGQFIMAERDPDLAFRGSRNQRLIDMNATRKQKRIVLYEA